ncbi:hypothetical protein [Bosea sp. TND4EK4]|uniref:hypothetical protein n=1 Tax=Bosea sp. TND4EK4 TaxID=1907408 RepID=UPI001FCE120C|nr:hypothetical protein [Bosea sp. TND4EK4]
MSISFGLAASRPYRWTSVGKSGRISIDPELMIRMLLVGYPKGFYGNRRSSGRRLR